MGAAERALKKLEQMTLSDLALQLMPCLLHAAYHALAGERWWWSNGEARAL